MKKTIILFLLALMPMMAIADSSGKCGDHLTWTYAEATNTLTISGNGGMWNFRDDPWYSFRSNIKTVVILNGVTSIGGGAFADCTRLTSVTIPNSVTSIDYSAFSDCTRLTSVNIPNSVTSISSYAFSGCSGLTSVNIPNSVTSINIYAFSGCSGLTSVNIPNSVTRIYDSTFSGCSGLTSVNIPNSVTYIDDYAFSGCSSLQEVVCLAKSFPSTSSNAFNNVSLSNVKLFVWSKLLERYRNNSPWSGFGTISAVDVQRDGFYYIFDTPNEEATVTDADNTSGNLNIPSYVVYEGVDYDVVAVHEYAFQNCSDMTSVNIPNSVTAIGNGAFEGCSGLTDLSIGKKIKSIGQNAFKGCSGLNSITVASGNTVYDSRNNSNAIIETATGKLIQGCNSTVIPDDVTSIGDAAFYNCSGLTSVNIGNSVTSIGNYAFYNCSGLTSINIPNGVTSIGYYALYNCSSLTSATIPNGVTSIGDYVFYKCSSLTSVNIPNSVTAIGNSAFSGCSSLTSVNISDLAAWCNLSFYSTSSNPLFYAHHLYLNGTEVTDLVIPNSLTSISSYAFYNCSGLTSVNIPNSVTTIGNYAFFGCSGLTSVNINSNAIVSANRTMNTSFKGIFGSQVKEYVIGDDVTAIGEYAFFGCNSLTSVTIGNSVTSIGQYAFQNCNGLTSVTLNSNDIVSADRTENDNLNSIFGSQVKEYVVGEDVTAIGQNAFRGITNLTTVSVGKNIGSIGDNAFYGCSNLATFTCYAADIPTANSSVFEGIDLTTATLYVPASAIEEYEETKPWRRFGTILPIDENTVPTAIDTAAADDYKEYFDLSGHRVTSSQRGLLIVRDRSGKTRKVMVK